MRLVINKNKLRLFFQIGLGLTLGLPIFYMLIFSLLNAGNNQHLDYLISVLPIHFSNSIKLVFWSVFFSLIISTYLACTFSLTNLWAKKIIKPLTYLPLGIPLYISCFVFEGMFSYSSPMSTFFRNTISFDITKIIHFDSAIQVGFIFSLYLSPYLTMPLSKAIESVGAGQWPVAKTMGLTTTEVVLKILIPSCIPWIIGGAIIISMETLADFGGVTAFNYDTLTTSIYTAWSGLFSLALAIKISFILLLLAAMLFFFEYRLNHKKQYSVLGSTFMAHPPIHLSITQNIFLLIPIIFYFSVAIILPLASLVSMADALAWPPIQLIEELTIDSFSIATTAALAITIFSLIHLSVYGRIKNISIEIFKRIGLFGYTLPGPIIAVAMIGVFALLREYITILPTSGTSLLLAGLLFRFVYIAISNIESSLKRIPPGLKNSASIYLENKWQLLKNLYIPFMKKSIPMAFLFVFIEVIKELPITLILKPFGTNTLATKIYEYTTEGEWEKAAQLSIILLIVLIPMSLIFNSVENKRHRNE